MSGYSTSTEPLPLEEGALGFELRLRHLALAIASVVVLVQLGGGDDLGAAAAMVGVGLAAVLAYMADWRYLPAIVLLAVPALGVVTEGEAGGGGLLSLVGIHFPAAVPYVFIGGVQVGVPLVVMLTGFGRVVLGLLTRSGKAAAPLPRWLLILFLIGLLPALLGGLQGQAMGHNRWSFGIRGMLAIAAVFWGALVVTRARVSREVIVKQLLGVIAIGSGLALLGVLRGHMLFLVIGLAAGSVPYFLRRRSLSLVPTLLTSMLAPVVATLTVAAQVLFAWGALAIASRRVRFARRVLVRASVAAAILASVGMIALVIAMRYDVGFASEADAGLLSFVMFQAAGRSRAALAGIHRADRRRSTLGDARGAPAPPRELPLPAGWSRRMGAWCAQQHSGTASHTGLVAGPIALALMVTTLLRVGRVLIPQRRSRPARPGRRGPGGGHPRHDHRQLPDRGRGFLSVGHCWNGARPVESRAGGVAGGARSGASRGRSRVQGE
jgi:hypothetical protein